jgi:hypothetical protein
MAPIPPCLAREDAAAERNSLLPQNYTMEEHALYGAVKPAGSEDDLEFQHHRREFVFWRSGLAAARKWLKADGTGVVRRLFPKRRVTVRDVWKQGVLQTVRLLPSVLLGLLFNMLDGLSYSK